jgi:uncharacterized protein YjbI with pentapeptide repeats
LHRGLLAFDLALVWTLWPGYRIGWGVRLWPNASWWLVAPGIGSAAALAYAAMVATFPDERIYVATYWLHGSTYLDPDAGEVSDTPNWYAFIAPVNTLDLHGQDLIDDLKLKQIIEKSESSADRQRWVATLSLRNRDLTGANLAGADVRHVEFSHATLNRANLNNAWAEKAHFDDNAQLQGASLDNAELQGASLDHAQLQGASLDVAHLQGAGLGDAQLRGAKLDANLRGAWLGFAELQGAWLYTAYLQGAVLVEVNLQGSELDEAHLQGALLKSAQLQGASLKGADRKGASFVDVCVWRTDARKAAWKDTMVARRETGPKVDKDHGCGWTAASFWALKQLIAKDVPEGDSRRDAMNRIEPSLDPAKALEGEDEMAKIWAARESPTPEAYAKTLAGQWRELGCAADGAPYVLQQFIARLNRPDNPDDAIVSDLLSEYDEPKALAAAFLDEAHCAGARGLSEADKATLKWIAAPAPPQAPKS